MLALPLHDDSRESASVGTLLGALSWLPLPLTGLLGDELFFRSRSKYFPRSPCRS